MDFQTFNYDKDKIFNYIQSIENDCDKINYLQRLNVEIEKVIISFNSAISTLNSTILFETHKQSRKLIDNIQYLLRHEDEYVIKVFDAYLKTEFLCYDNLAVVLSSYFKIEISAEIKTGLRTDIYYSFIKWLRKENNSPRNVLKYSEFYLKNFNEGSVYHNSTTDEIVIRLCIKMVVNVFVSEMQDLNDIKSMVNNKFKYYQKLSELKDQTEPIPDVQPERGKAIDIKTDEQVDVFRLTKKEKSIVRKLGEPGITIEITDKYTGAKSLSFKKTGKLNITKCSNLLGLDVKTFKHYKPLFDNAISSREKQS